jgi:hypothetical protein
MFIKWVASQFVFFFGNESCWLTHNNSKIVKLGGSPKEQFLCEDKVSPLWLIYIGEKGRTLGKGYGIKWGVLGTHCKLEEHRCEQVDNTWIKEFQPHPPPPQEEKYESSWCMFIFLIDFMYILFLGMVANIFLPSLISLL